MMPFSSLIPFVEKLVWAPAPFQSPGMGLGSSVATTPNSSATRCRINLDIHSWSPISMPTQGPTWYSHCEQSIPTSQLQQEGVVVLSEMDSPALALLPRCYLRSGCRRKGKPCSDIRRCPSRRPCWHRRRSSTVLGGRENRSWATRAVSCPCPAGCTPVQFQTTARNLRRLPWLADTWPCGWWL